MSYTALDAMRKKNRERFGRDLGPARPPLFPGEETGSDLKCAALRFLEMRCRDLRFDPEKENEEERTGQYLGASLLPNQIPYNMQMDIDRLCLKNELAKFIDSGVAEDAYTVYYCYLEMFIGEYGRSQSMVELLSEFESNASSLLMKHRDHYSHSVYVFALGLAIYEMNSDFRRAFCDFYRLESPESPAAAAFFLKYWGLTSLFHDIGYPFEIPFEQVISYFEVDRKKRENGLMFIAYHDLDQFTAISAQENARLKELYGRSFSSVCDLLAHGIFLHLGKAYDLSEEHLLEVIESKPTHPEQNGYFMDHAFFSASRLYRELVSIPDAEPLTKAHVDALTAIMLHNSLYKFRIAFYKDKDPEKRKAPLKKELHPLAWLLMLCDELQCWDRTAYGRNSRTELHPMAADFHFTGNAIHGVYHYDIEEKQKIHQFWEKYFAWEEANDGSKPPRLKDYSDTAAKEQRFRKDIESIVDLTGFPLFVDSDLRPVDRKIKHTYLSSSSFLHIYDFAVALNARYNYQGKEEEVDLQQLEKEFNELSLEYKLLNINQVRVFARYLDAIDCFYTDKPVDFDILQAFVPEMTEVFAPMEHARWVRDHQASGWQYGNEYETLPLPEGTENEKAVRKALREQLRRHKLTLNADASTEEILAHYKTLTPEDQGKDWLPYNSMLKLLRRYEGLRIYHLNKD
ncbi:MAG: hypothetical protein IJI09_06200 [Clostridia bacterium]|nr:hypothetical protein [Clostridia bacterium]